MVALGILFLLIGSISEWVVDNHVLIGNQSVDMDLVGMIFLILGGISIVIGLIYALLFTNTTHTEDVRHDVVVDEVPGEEPRRVVRRRRRDYP